ncbi:MAG: acetylxylan esterase [Kiritimatiellae bacterium]|nr:acetylxylan esterase [Kiritimatiellia bacterium]
MKKLIALIALSLSVITNGEINVEEWENVKRPQVLTWFREHVYGIAPISRPGDIEFGERHVSMAGGKIKIEIFLALPKGASAENPVPVFIFGDHSNVSKTFPIQKRIYDNVPTNSITARGYAYVCFNCNDVAPNTHAKTQEIPWNEGVFKVYGGDEPNATSWGTISAWAWGYSRVMDWIETRPELDAKRVAVVGHSRGGKTALWAAAQDERFALGISNNSGCGGAKLNKMDLPRSEHAKQILTNFPFWFCLNFREYIGKDDQVKYDQDDLIRLLAPRLAYVASASEDPWAGPEGEFEAARRASDIWKAYGKRGLSLTSYPKPETQDHSGHIGFHLRKGKHKLLPSDWKRFMDFADKYMK